MDKENLRKKNLPVVEATEGQGPDSELVEQPVQHRVESNRSSKELAEQLKDQVSKIESGELPAVDPGILEKAKKAAALQESGAGISDQKRLEELLNMLHGDAGDAALFLDDVLKLSEPDRSKTSQN